MARGAPREERPEQWGFQSHKRDALSPTERPSISRELKEPFPGLRVGASYVNRWSVTRGHPHLGMCCLSPQSQDVIHVIEVGEPHE